MGAIEHTPGPWRHCGDADAPCKCGQVWSETANCPVAECNGVWGDDLDNPYGEVPPEAKAANMRLVALAPTAPHECSDATCAGNRNRLKLAAAEKMCGALRKVYRCGVVRPFGTGSGTHRDMTKAIAAYESACKGEPT